MTPWRTSSEIWRKPPNLLWASALRLIFPYRYRGQSLKINLLWRGSNTTSVEKSTTASLSSSRKARSPAFAKAGVVSHTSLWNLKACEIQISPRSDNTLLASAANVDINSCMARQGTCAPGSKACGNGLFHRTTSNGVWGCNGRVGFFGSESAKKATLTPKTTWILVLLAERLRLRMICKLSEPVRMNDRSSGGRS